MDGAIDRLKRTTFLEREFGSQAAVLGVRRARERIRMVKRLKTRYTLLMAN